MSHTAVIFLKEPGKSATIKTQNLSTDKTQKLLTPGVELKLKVKGNKYSLLFGKDAVANIEDPVTTQKIGYALDKNLELRFFVIKKSRHELEILLRCDKAIFLTKKPDIRPFTKHEEFLEENLSRNAFPEDNQTEEAEEELPPEED